MRRSCEKKIINFEPISYLFIFSFLLFTYTSPQAGPLSLSI